MVPENIHSEGGGGGGEGGERPGKFQRGGGLYDELVSRGISEAL